MKGKIEDESRYSLSSVWKPRLCLHCVTFDLMQGWVFHITHITITIAITLPFTLPPSFFFFNSSIYYAVYEHSPQTHSLRHKYCFELVILYFVLTHLRGPSKKGKEIRCFMQDEKSTDKKWNSWYKYEGYHSAQLMMAMDQSFPVHVQKSAPGRWRRTRSKTCYSISKSFYDSAHDCPWQFLFSFRYLSSQPSWSKQDRSSHSIRLKNPPSKSRSL